MFIKTKRILCFQVSMKAILTFNEAELLDLIAQLMVEIIIDDDENLVPGNLKSIWDESPKRIRTPKRQFK